MIGLILLMLISYSRLVSAVLVPRGVGLILRMSHYSIEVKCQQCDTPGI